MSLNIPFSWETQPGINKEQQTGASQEIGGGSGVICLPPPPCQVEKRLRDNNVHGIQVPWSTIPAKRTDSNNGRHYKKAEDRDDPFLVAYKECTKDTKDMTGGKDEFVLGKEKKKKKKKSMVVFNSCKETCGVRDDNTVKVSQIPLLISGRGDKMSQPPASRSRRDDKISQLPVSRSHTDDKISQQLPVSRSNRDDNIVKISSQPPVLKSLKDHDSVMRIWELPISRSLKDAKL